MQIPMKKTATSPSGQGFVFAGWREMQIHMIKKKIDRHGVVHRNSHLAAGCSDFDIVTRGRYIQVLNGLEDAFADLLFALMLHYSKSRDFLDFIVQLVLRGIRRNQLEAGVNSENQNGSNNQRLELARAALRPKFAVAVVDRRQFPAPTVSFLLFSPAMRS